MTYSIIPKKVDVDNVTIETNEVGQIVVAGLPNLQSDGSTSPISAGTHYTKTIPEDGKYLLLFSGYSASGGQKGGARFFKNGTTELIRTQFGEDTTYQFEPIMLFFIADLVVDDTFGINVFNLAGSVSIEDSNFMLVKIAN